MEKFKDFKKKPKPPVIITAEPCHGTHSMSERPKAKRKVVKEEVATKWAKRVPPEMDNPISKWSRHEENHHLGKDYSEVHAKIDHDPDKFHSHSDSHRVRAYSEYSAQTNGELIKHATGRRKESFFHPSQVGGVYETHGEQKAAHAEHKEQVRGIDRFLGSHKLDHDLHVFHGTNRWHPGEEAAKHPHGHIQMPGFTSTSISKHTALGFAGGGAKPDDQMKKWGVGESHVLHIKLNKGQKGAYLGSNSEHAHEREFLLPRKTTLKIHPKPDVHEHENKKVHVWHAEVVHHDK